MFNTILDIGEWFQGIMNPAINLVKEEAIAPFLAVIVIIAAIIIFITATYKWFFKQKPILDEAYNILSLSNTQEEFAENIFDIDDKMKILPGIGHCWSEFYETLVPPIDEGEEESEPPIYQNTVRPYDFFTTEEAGFETPILQIIPNIFVGVGLAITFFGLIAALTIATDGMIKEGNLEESIQGLLTAASAKFYTSLFALLSSIVLTIYIRFLNSAKNRAFTKISMKLENLVRYLSEARIALDQIQYIKNQTLQMETFNSDLAVRLGESIQTAMMPVTQKLDEMANNMGQSNMDAIREISEQVASQVQGAAGDQLNAIGDRLGTLSDTLGNLSGTLENSSNQFGEDITQTFQNIQTQMTEVADSLKSNAEDASNVMAERIESLATSLSSAAEEMKNSMQEGATALTSELTTAIDSLTNATNNSAQKMEEAVDGIKGAMDGIVGSLEENADKVVSNATNGIAKAGDSAAQAFENAGNELSSALSSSSESLIKALGTLSEKFNVTQTSITSLNQSMTNTSTGLNAAKDAISSSANNLTAASNQLKPIIDPVIKSISELRSTSETISGAVTRMKEELTKTSQIFDKHTARYDGVDQKLATIFTTVQSDMQNSLAKMSEFVIKIDDNFSSSVGALQEAVEELTDERKANTNQGNN